MKFIYSNAVFDKKIIIKNYKIISIFLVYSIFQVQEARNQHDEETVKRYINEYEDTLGR